MTNFASYAPQPRNNASYRINPLEASLKEFYEDRFNEGADEFLRALAEAKPDAISNILIRKSHEEIGGEVFYGRSEFAQALRTAVIKTVDNFETALNSKNAIFPKLPSFIERASHAASTRELWSTSIDLKYFAKDFIRNLPAQINSFIRNA